MYNHSVTVLSAKKIGRQSVRVVFSANAKILENFSLVTAVPYAYEIIRILSR